MALAHGYNKPTNVCLFVVVGVVVVVVAVVVVAGSVHHQY